MKKIRIIAKTFSGEKAIDQHIAETFRLSWRQKAMFRQMGFRQEIVSFEPKILELSMKNKRLMSFVRPEHFLQEIYDSLKENGAIKDEDYIVEVE